MRYKSVAKRKIIELEETLDYSDGQAVGFGSTKGRDGLAGPDIRGVAPHRGEFSRRLDGSHRAARLPRRVYDSNQQRLRQLRFRREAVICDAIWLS